MTPAEVPDELVEAAALVMHSDECPDDGCEGGDLCQYERTARNVLAAVLPDARYAAKVEAVAEARKVISQYLATAEKWRYERVMWAFAIMLSEIPEDTPEPGSMPTFGHVPAARLRAAETERTS